MTGGLFDPLGTDRADLPLGRPRPPVSVVIAGTVVAALILLLAASYLRDDGDRGRPVAVAPIEHVQAPPSAPVPPAAAPLLPPPSAAPGLPPVRADQEVEIQNGVRIVRPRRDAPASGSATIRVPDASPPR